MKKSYSIDMCSGPIMRKMIAYTIPIMLTGFLQLLYNAADLVVIGQFSNQHAFAAVGATGSLYNLFMTLFFGISGGGCICVAQYYGARDGKNVSETVHTCILFSIIGGIVVGVFGFIFVEDALKLMGTHEDIIDMSALYLRIVLSVTPFTLFYNFAAGILRATGDTKRPFYILVITGAVNVTLNLVFVIIFKMSVDGVALATAIGSVLNAVFAAYLLMNSGDSIRLNLRHLRIHGDKLIKILNYGIPSALQSLLFSVSNVIIQSAVNSFKIVAVVGGNSASSSIEGFIYTAMNSIAQTSLNFSGQNYGARQYKRIDKVLINSCILTTITGVVMGAFALIFSEPLLRIYEPTGTEAVGYGLIRLTIIASTYFLCGNYEAIMSALRGIGSSWAPTIIALISVGGVRIVWIYTIFQKFHTLQTLYISWPLTWITSIILLTITYQATKKKYFDKNEKQFMNSGPTDEKNEVAVS